MCRMFDNWTEVHFEVLLAVNRDNDMKFYRHCGILGSNKMYTEDKYKQLQIQYMQYVQYWMQCNINNN